MSIKESIKNRVSEFISLCKKHNVKQLYVFGSAMTSDFNEVTSDVDLLIEIDDNDPLERGDKLISIWNHFEDFFQRKVDLLTYASIKNPILKQNIDRTKKLIYDGEKQEVSF